MNRFSETLFQVAPIVGILRGYTPEKTLNIVEAYYQAVFRTIEITMNTSNVATIIATLVEKYGGRLNIGAGTVCNEADLKIALELSLIHI